MTRTLRPAQWTFALAVTASLGFGATQAFASTEAAPDLRACDSTSCRASCISTGWPTGFCTTAGSCICFRP